MNSKGEEPAVRFWGAWNEPDIAATSLHADPGGAIKAAYLWGEAQLAADEAGCAHQCDIVAGEFQVYGEHAKYIKTYDEAIIQGLRKHAFPVKVPPRFWGLHDYRDLREVQGSNDKGKEILGNYLNKEAKGFARYTRGMSSFRSAHIWLSEQGVLLKDKELTRLYRNIELQRLAAQDFLKLGRSSEHFERSYYYLYEGPTAAKALAQKEKYPFDSALLAGEGVHEEQDPREAYCVLALGDNAGCPGKGTTKTPVADTITTSASTVLVDVYPEGLPTKYVVQYGTSTAYGDTTSSAELTGSLGGQSETVSLSGLESCKIYHYQVEVENEANEGTPSLGGDQTFRTKCTATEVSVGGGFACALIADSEVECWGSNTFGELGDGTTVNSSIPVPVSSLSDVTEISAGQDQACALLGTGHVDCWGNNEYGELGDGTTLSSSTPVEVTGISDAIAVSTGEYTSCALLSTGKVDCWGWNDDGQLGDGTTENSSTPVPVSELTDVIAIDASNRTPCAIISGGELKCWGSNSQELLDYHINYLRESQSESHSSTPLTMPVSGVKAVTDGAEQICALEESDDVYCWGNTLVGTLNNGIYSGHGTQLTPWEEASGMTTLSGGSFDDCGIVSGGVKCWGDDEFGQLGDGVITSNEGEGSQTPVAASGISGAIAVSAGYTSGCALLSDGDIDCWGWGEDGDLGDGSEEASATPTPVVGFG